MSDCCSARILVTISYVVSKQVIFLSAALTVGALGTIFGFVMICHEITSEEGWVFIVANGALLVLAAASMVITWRKRTHKR